MIQFAPADRIEIAEQAGGIVVPAPPYVPRQRPQPLARRSDEEIQGAGFGDQLSHLRGRLHQALNLMIAEYARLDGLHDQNSLQHASIDKRNTQKRFVPILTRFREIFESRM